ncbi:uncharacterized protein G6M90_00g096980 [Metarhizium brunneum]|uniref:Uncharacterized protein n=1 Tax=Metarhizium brunneum TaxID=500148 RepID=A0A7D5YXJ3_9HYPO|nr:hypothetical protein G6M90_00g096980 [Metarhizium brunneum]
MMQTGKTQDSQLLLLLGFEHGSFLSAGLEGRQGRQAADWQTCVGETAPD